MTMQTIRYKGFFIHCKSEGNTEEFKVNFYGKIRYFTTLRRARRAIFNHHYTMNTVIKGELL